ncbi:WD repeat-containing protein 83 [Entomophthora muscae]|uniref:WD repeat-containing protein 83 n=1 Tax=Entomophthora muscae TaxID=34485 RepID=A0ACC2SCR0_9FUNG|nr:WD repeat-containing protein 83 [Entomophthora muscae]
MAAIVFNKTGSYDTTVRLWDCRSQSRLPIQILEEGKDSIISLRILGHEILTGSVDNKVRHYDLRMGKLATDDLPGKFLSQPPLTGQASVTNVAFTKDANCFLVSSLDSTIRLLDKADGTLLNHFNAHTNVDYKIAAVTNFDDSQVITGSEDGQVYIYDLLEGTVLTKLANNSKRVTSVAAHPSEPQLLTSSFDGVITVWEAPA